jgi:uncharacterized protein YdaU (DUF1376 family)
MSKADTWMPLHIGDYLSDTGHLRTVEHGAYLLLLMHYWRSGPLPDDDGRLAAIVRLSRREWSEIAPTMREMFTSVDGRLHQKRADIERAKAVALSDKRRAVAEARWGSKEKQAECKDNAIASPIAVQKDAPARSHDLNPNPNLLPPEEKEELPSLRSGVANDALPLDLPNDFNNANEAVLGRVIVPAEPVQPEIPRREPKHYNDDPDFLEFWRWYPRKDEKADAWKAWRGAIKKAKPSDIIAGLKEYRFEADPKFQKMPAGWLRGERWLGQSSTPPLKVNEAANPKAWMFEPEPVPQFDLESTADVIGTYPAR